MNADAVQITATLTATPIPVSDQWAITKDGTEYLGLVTIRPSGAYVVEGRSDLHPTLAAAALDLAYAHKPAEATVEATRLEAAMAAARQAGEDHKAAIDARDEAEADLNAARRILARAEASLAAAEARRVQARAEAAEADEHLTKVRAWV